MAQRHHTAAHHQRVCLPRTIARHRSAHLLSSHQDTKHRIRLIDRQRLILCIPSFLLTLHLLMLPTVNITHSSITRGGCDRPCVCRGFAIQRCVMCMCTEWSPCNTIVGGYHMICAWNVSISWHHIYSQHMHIHMPRCCHLVIATIVTSSHQQHVLLSTYRCMG